VESEAAVDHILDALEDGDVVENLRIA
jgi:hypothetical protein